MFQTFNGDEEIYRRCLEAWGDFTPPCVEAKKIAVSRTTSSSTTPKTSPELTPMTDVEELKMLLSAEPLAVPPTPAGRTEAVSPVSEPTINVMSCINGLSNETIKHVIFRNITSEFTVSTGDEVKIKALGLHKEGEKTTALRHAYYTLKKEHPRCE